MEKRRWTKEEKLKILEESKKEGKSVYCKEEAASLLHFWNLYGRVAGHENNALYDLKISFMGHSIGYFRYIR